MLYVLSSAQQIFSVTVRVQESRQGDGAAAANLALNMKQYLSSEVFDEQQRYLNNAAIAAYVSFNKIDQRNRFKASVSLSPQLGEDNYSFIEGSSSSGLGYALSLFDAWWHEVLAKPSLADSTIFCTGEIGRNGEIKPISYQNEKIRAAIRLTEAQQISAFTICLPKANEADVPDELKEQAIASGGRLIFADRLQTLLGTLYGDAYDGDPLGRWEAFKGLKSFNYEDSIRFFGRDKDTQRLLNDLQSNDGILIVSGQSGSGKSSLVKAGLIPQLEKTVDHLKWVTTTPKEVQTSFLDDLLTHLAKGAPENNPISPVQIIQGLLEDTLDVSSVAHLVADNALFLYHIDQFEELYTTDIGQKAEAQLSALQRLTQLNKRIKVVLSIRNEYLPILLESGEIKSPVISNVSGNLDYAAWQAIVLEQAAFSGYEFEQQQESLAHAIIDDAVNTPNSLPMVEFVLQQLAEQAKQSDQPILLTHHAYQAMGRLVGAIAQRADEVIDVIHTDPITIHHFFSLFVGTTTDGLPFAKRLGYKNSGIEVDQPLNDIIKRAIDASILISASNLADGVELKLAHDCLFNHWNALKQWLSDQEAFLQWRNAVDYGYQQWANDQKSTYLIDDARLLNQGLNFIKKNLIAEPKLIAYVKRSKGRKRNGLLSILGLLLLIAMAISLYFYDQYRIKIEYHSAIAEKWSVPYGIRPLDEETVKHRTGSYKLEYQNGKLRTLSYVNSYGTIIKTDQSSSMSKYHYDESGMVSRIEMYNEYKQLYNVLDFSSIPESINRKVRTYNKELNLINADYSSSVDNRTRGQVFAPYFLVEYDNDGKQVAQSFFDIYNKRTHFKNSYKIKFEYNKFNLVSSVYFLDLYDKNSYNEEGVSIINYDYDRDYLTLINKKDIYKSQDEVIGRKTLLDRYGNESHVIIYDVRNNFSLEKENSVSVEGFLTKESYAIKGIKPKSIGQYVASVNYLYDNFGRVVSVNFIDQNGTEITSRFDELNILTDIAGINEYTGVNIQRDKNGFITNLNIFGNNKNDGCNHISVSYDNNFANQVNCIDENKSLHFPYTKMLGWHRVKRIIISDDIHYYSDDDIFYRKHVRDENGYIASERVYKNDKLVVDVEFKYDNYGNKILEKSLPIDNYHVPITNNINELAYTFDYYGNITEISAFKNNHVPAAMFDNVHKNVIYYNYQGIYKEKSDRLDINNNIIKPSLDQFDLVLLKAPMQLIGISTDSLSEKSLEDVLLLMLDLWNGFPNLRSFGLANKIGYFYQKLGMYTESSNWYLIGIALHDDTKPNIYDYFFINSFINYEGVAPNYYRYLYFLSKDLNSDFPLSSSFIKFKDAIFLKINKIE